MQAQGLSSLDAKKGSMLSTLSKMDFKVTDHHAITKGIKAVMNAKDENSLNTGIKAVMNNLEAAHTKVFAAHALARFAANTLV